MKYNIVTNYKLIQLFKKSKYFQLSLGYASTVESQTTGERFLSDKDKFAYFYNTQYKTTIMCQGAIGTILLYTDHYIKEDKIAAYCDAEEFIFDFDDKLFLEKGIDFYLGSILKKIEIDHSSRLEKKKEYTEEIKSKVGNPDLLTKNPGSVTYADVKSYMEKKNRERMDGTKPSS